jgi:hypothetical protein
MRKTVVIFTGVSCFSIGKSDEQKPGINNETYYQPTAEDAMRDKVLQDSSNLPYTNFVLKLGNSPEDS